MTELSGAATAPSSSAPTPVRRASRWRALPLSAIAALVIALTGVVALIALVPRPALVAGLWTIDHLKCLLLVSEAGYVRNSALEADWQRRHGWTVTVPPSSNPERLRLVGMRRCVSAQGETAHVVYAQATHRLSLFISRRSGQGATELAIMGYDVVTWSANGRTYAVVSDLPRDSLRRVAGYLQAYAR